MTIRKSNLFLNLVNSYTIDSPQPSNISYLWNLGSLLALCLIIQLGTGIFLAMHYSSNIDLAFLSVEHIIYVLIIIICLYIGIYTVLPIGYISIAIETIYIHIYI